MFQSLGRPIENLVLSMSRQLLFLIPIVLILPPVLENLFGYGAYGLACAQALSDLFSFLFLALPMMMWLFRKLKPLKDGDDHPFVSKKKHH